MGNAPLISSDNLLGHILDDWSTYMFKPINKDKII